MGRPKAVDITSTPKLWLTKAEASGYLSIDDTDNFDIYFPNLTKHIPPGKPDSNKYWYEKAEIDAMLAASTAQQVKDKLLPPTMRRPRIKHNTSS